MSNRFAKCMKCPAYHLLTDNRKGRIEKWEYKRRQNIDRIKRMRLILIGESMPDRGWLKNEIPESIKSRVVKEFSFKNIKGLKELYLSVKAKEK